MGVAPKNNIHDHSFLWNGAYEFTYIIVVTKNGNKQV